MEITYIDPKEYKDSELFKALSNINTALKSLINYATTQITAPENLTASPVIDDYASKLSSIMSYKSSLLTSSLKRKQDIIILKQQLKTEITTKEAQMEKVKADREHYSTEKSDCMTLKAQSINDITLDILKKAKALSTNNSKKGAKSVMSETLRLFIGLLKGSSDATESEINAQFKNPQALINLITKYEPVNLDKGVEQDIDKKVQECRQKLSPTDIDASIEQNKQLMIPFLIYTQNTLLIYGNKKKIVAKEKEIDEVTS
jgi:hypothetical protein